MYLLCPKCGFSFGLFLADNVSEEDKIDLMTCPCGTMMEEVNELMAVLIEEGSNGSRTKD